MLNVSDSNKYMVSFTEMAITYGLLDSRSEQTKYALVFIQNAIECNSENGNSSNSDNLNNIKSLILSLLPPDNVCQYSVENDNGVSEKTHKDYFADFGKDYYDNVKRLVDSYVHNDSQLRTDDLYTEVLQHSTACMNYVKKFQGRQDIIERIKSYVLDDEKAPMIVYGQSGSGKTSVLGKTASMVRDWLPEADRESAIVLLRFLGTSPGTSSIQQTLKYLCKQLACFGNSDDIENAASLDDFKELLATFYRLLERFGEFRKIIVFLDSVDQLDSSNGAYYLTWFRTELPNNVKMIVSTLPEMFDLLKTFKAKLPNENMYVEVKPLEQNLCKDILTALLFENKRKLSDVQWKFVEQAFTKCSLPIYVNLLYHQVLNWHSYDTIDDFSLKYSVRAAIFDLFNGLEARYGKLFTSHALAYITASRNGLSETELEDLISLDDDVLRDVFQYHLPPLIRIPPFCWARLRHDIGSYLVEREADNVRVVYWYHRQFIEVAQEYFLGNEEFKKRIHSAMADYFLGLWGGGKKKIFVYPTYLRKKMNLPESNIEDRIVPEQPYILRTDENNTVTYNLRKLNELPWHLCKSGRLEEFYDYCNFDYEFLLYKLCATSRSLLLKDLELPVGLNDQQSLLKEADYVYNAIRLSALSLNFDPAANLGVDLVGRLTMYEKMGHSRIKLLLSQVRTSKLSIQNCCLLPSIQCFDSGSGYLYSSFDIGLAFGIIMPRQRIVSFCLINNDVIWFDLSGNEIKRFTASYNLLMGIKYMASRPISEDCVAYMTCVRPKGLDGAISWREACQRYLDFNEAKLSQELNDLKEKGLQDSELEEAYEKNKRGVVLDEDLNNFIQEFNIILEPTKKIIDVLKVDLESGKTALMATLPSSVAVSLETVEVVTDKYVLARNRNIMDGFADLYVFNMQTKSYLPLYNSDISVPTVVGAHFLSFSQNILAFATGVNLIKARDVNNINTLVVHDFENDTIMSFNFVSEIVQVLSNTIITVCNDNMDESEVAEQILKSDQTYFRDNYKVKIVGIVVKDRDKITVYWLSKSSWHSNKKTCTQWLTILNVQDNEIKVECSHLLELSPSILNTQTFLSLSGRKAVFIAQTDTTELTESRGLLYDCQENSYVYLNMSNRTEKERQKYASHLVSFGNGVLARFSEEDRVLVTSGNKALMLVWSTQTGNLLQVFYLGIAHSVLCGQVSGTHYFVICHFPDESSSREQMFLTIKVYNFENISIEKDTENELDFFLPNYVTFQSSYVNYAFESRNKFILSLADEYMHINIDNPNIIEGRFKHENMDSDTNNSSYYETIQLSTNDRATMKEPFAQLLLIKHHNFFKGKSIIRIISLHADTLEPYQSLLKPMGSTLYDNTLEIVFTDLSNLDTFTAPLNFKCQFLKTTMGIIDKHNQKIILFNISLNNLRESRFFILRFKPLEARPKSSMLFSKDEISMCQSLLTYAGNINYDCISEDFLTRFYDDVFVNDLELPKSQKKREAFLAVQPDLNEELTDDKKLEKLEKFIAKYWTKPNVYDTGIDVVEYQYDQVRNCINIAIGKIGRITEIIISGTGRSVIWLGRVITIGFSDILNNWENENGQPTTRSGKLFDMGSTVVFLDDGQHLINYKLQVVNYVHGTVVRTILPPEEQVHYLLLKATPDLKYIVGQVYFSAYEVEFFIDLGESEKKDEDMFANDPARVIQVYQLSDGKRLANYMFEFEPTGFCICGKEGRDVLVLMNNAPILVFHITDPMLQTEQLGRQMLAPEDNVSLSWQSQTLIESRFLADTRAPGPKPEYIEKLAPVLASAMTAVVRARPQDPIDFLAKWLLNYADANPSQK